MKPTNLQKRQRISFCCFQCNSLNTTPLSAYIKKEKHFCSQNCYTQYQKINILGDKHPRWKGDKVGYHALHNWVVRRLGRPSKCEFCGTTEVRKYEWANKSGNYLRDITDWHRLCTSCHRLYDNRRKRIANEA